MLSPLERRRFRVRWVASTAHRHGRLRLLGRPRQRAPRSWRIAARRWPHRSESSSLPPGHPRAVARTVTEPNSKPELGRQRQRHALRKLRPSQRRLRARETRQALVHPPRRRGVHADARAMAQQPRVHRVHAGGPPRVIASVVRCTTGGHPAAGPECTVIRQRRLAFADFTLSASNARRIVEGNLRTAVTSTPQAKVLELRVGGRTSAAFFPRFYEGRHDCPDWGSNPTRPRAAL